jgi:hypothetical protein
MEATSEEEGRSNWDKWEGDRYLRKTKNKKQKTKCPAIPFSKVRFVVRSVLSRTFGYKWEIGTSPKKKQNTL